MFWVVQSNLFREENYEQLLMALERQNIPHAVVDVLPFVNQLQPEPVIPDNQLVFVCGSTKLMRIALERDWSPGAFMNENMRHEAWDAALGEDLLNHGAFTSTLGAVQFPEPGEFFIRPCEDGKAFTGRCFYKAEFEKWRQHLTDSEGILVNGKLERYKVMAQDTTPVLVAPFRKILREFRFFVVNGKIVTGSLYKMGGRACSDATPDQEVWGYCKRIIKKWQPAPAYVVDIALTEDGPKVLEYNCVNCSGFYACDVAKIVDAMESLAVLLEAKVRRKARLHV